MSTFYATLQQPERARELALRFLREGVSPDDLSVITRQTIGDPQQRAITEIGNPTVGDSSFIVGRSDDPGDREIQLDYPIPTELTTLEQSRISPIDTSNSDDDVESVDQMEDSQSEAERQTEPYAGISQGEHEKDDLALTVETGFPTMPPLIENAVPGDFPRQSQYEESLETLVMPEGGTVMGGGPLATAAFDFLAPGPKPPRLYDYLREEGVPEDSAFELNQEFQRGSVLIAVNVNPGRILEGPIEEIAEQYGASHLGLFDAPRYTDHEAPDPRNQTI